MKQLLPVLLLLLGASTLATAQDCTNGRYYDQLFQQVDISSGVLYGENIQPTIFNPNATQELFVDIYEPMGDSETARPLIIWAFGGAFVAGSRTSFDIVELCTRLAKAGYVCASIDYRLSPELGLGGDADAATRAVQKGTHDMRGAVRFFRENATTDNTWGIDADAIYVGGVSAGGFCALHLAYLDKPSELPAALTGDSASVGGIEGLSGTPGVSSHVAGVLNLCGALGDKNWMEEGDPALMSVHGTEDDVVPYGSGMLTILGLNMPLDGSAALHPLATTLGIPNSFTSLPGAAHTPFALGDNVPAYMDTTWWAVRNFMHWRTCGPPAAVPEVRLAPESLELPVYPAPANGVATIVIPPKNVGSVVVTTLAGKRMNPNWKLTGNGVSVDTQALPSGTYFVQVLKPWSTALAGTTKMIVQH